VDQALIEALKAEGVEGAMLLDIGGGVGVIPPALLAAGGADATYVDAAGASWRPQELKSWRSAICCQAAATHMRAWSTFSAASIVTCGGRAARCW
jgi:hypothetical protein